MGFWNLHVLLCNLSTAFSASFCGHPKDFAAEMVDVLFFLSSDTAALGPWPWVKALSPAEHRHWMHQCWGAPGEPLVAPFLAFIIVTKLTPVPSQWQLWSKGERSAIYCHLLGCSLPQVIPTLFLSSSLKNRMDFPLFSPHRHHQIFMLLFHPWLWFLHGIFFFWWHFYHGNRKISECFVKISVVSFSVWLTWGRLYIAWYLFVNEKYH